MNEVRGGPGGVTEAGREKRAGQAGRVGRGGPWKGIGLGRAGDRGRPIGLPSREDPHRVEPGGGREGRGDWELPSRRGPRRLRNQGSTGAGAGGHEA